MRIWIDDVRPAPEGWEWAKNSTDAIAIIEKTPLQNIDLISFDHDLGGDDTSVPIVNYVEERVVESGEQAPKMLVHSQNPVGRDNLKRAIQAIYSRNPR
jgi:hypothetical protein